MVGLFGVFGWMGGSRIFIECFCVNYVMDIESDIGY